MQNAKSWSYLYILFNKNPSYEYILIIPFVNPAAKLSYIFKGILQKQVTSLLCSWGYIS